MWKRVRSAKNDHATAARDLHALPPPLVHACVWSFVHTCVADSLYHERMGKDEFFEDDEESSENKSRRLSSNFSRLQELYEQRGRVIEELEKKLSTKH